MDTETKAELMEGLKDNFKANIRSAVHEVRTEGQRLDLSPEDVELITTDALAEM